MKVGIFELGLRQRGPEFSSRHLPMVDQVLIDLAGIPRRAGAGRGGGEGIGW